MGKDAELHVEDDTHPDGPAGHLSASPKSEPAAREIGRSRPLPKVVVARTQGRIGAGHQFRHPAQQGKRLFRHRVGIRFGRVNDLNA